MDNDVIVHDLIANAYDQKPLEFETTFNLLIADKLVQAINDKKLEVAQSMFTTREEEEDGETS